jgi:glycosyltransferase involved in cell wall biosynthesis
MSNPGKQVIVSVINDLTTDQRVDRVCTTLTGMGFRVLLVGRKLKNSLPLAERPYRTKRMKLIFTKGPVFYAEYNLRLFFFLISKKTDILVSNDLDTLLASYCASKLKRVPLVHDCHEYFRGMPELNGRKVVTRAWKAIEDHVFPKLKSVYAVNGSIASIYQKEYRNNIHVIRNVPVTKTGVVPKKKSELGIPGEHRVILYQGAVNVDRGLEEAIMAMKLVKTPATLLIMGTGDVFDSLQKLVRDQGVDDKVKLEGQVPFAELPAYTALGDIGLSIEKDVSLNYHYCLPNKFLDYIQSRVPVLVSPLPEMLALVEKYAIGETISGHEPAYLAGKFDEMLGDPAKLERYRTNLAKAAADLCWENEEPLLKKIFEPYA